MVYNDIENPLWIHPVWTSDHLPFGETVNESGSAFDPLLRYPGQWAVPESEGLGLTELFYNGYRWYRAEWGRYSQADPVGLLGGVNLFGYVIQNPLRFTDPLGLWKQGDVIYRCRPKEGESKIDCEECPCDVAMIWRDPHGAENRDFFDDIDVLTYGPKQDLPPEIVPLTQNGGGADTHYPDYQYLGTIVAKELYFAGAWYWKRLEKWGNRRYGATQCFDLVNFMWGDIYLGGVNLGEVLGGQAHDLTYWKERIE